MHRLRELRIEEQFPGARAPWTQLPTNDSNSFCDESKSREATEQANLNFRIQKAREQELNSGITTPRNHKIPN